MKPIKRAIILCWVMLVACLIIKLLGGNWFEIAVNNEHFTRLCETIDNNVFLLYGMSWLVYIISANWIMAACSLLPIPKTYEMIANVICFSFVWSMQFISNIVKIIVEIVAFIAIPIAFNFFRNRENGVRKTIKKTWFYGIIGYIFIFLFQAISLVTRNIGIKFTDDNTLVTFVLLIDYYIMVVLYYLYVLNYRKEKGYG